MGTVLYAMQQKARVPDSVFKKYVEALMGNKDEEAVFKCVAAV